MSWHREARLRGAFVCRAVTLAVRRVPPDTVRFGKLTCFALSRTLIGAHAAFAHHPWSGALASPLVGPLHHPWSGRLAHALITLGRGAWKHIRDRERDEIVLPQARAEGHRVQHMIAIARSVLA